MKNRTMGVLASSVLMISLLGVSSVFGQVRFVDLTVRKKLVLKGQLPAGGQRFYVFRAKPGQTLTARLISANRRAVFSVDVVYNIGPPIVSETIVEGKTSWSGSLPELDSDLFGIEVTTPAGKAAYRLEITLQ